MNQFARVLIITLMALAVQAAGTLPFGGGGAWARGGGGGGDGGSGGQGGGGQGDGGHGGGGQGHGGHGAGQDAGKAGAAQRGPGRSGRGARSGNRGGNPGGRDPSIETDTLAIGIDRRTIAAVRALGARTQTASLAGLGMRITRFRSPDAATNAALRARLGTLAPDGQTASNHLFRPMGTPSSGRPIAGWVELEPVGPCARQLPIGMVDTGLADVAADDRIVTADFPDSDGLSPFRDHHGAVVGQLIRLVSGSPLYAANAFATDADGQVLATALSLIRSLDWLVVQEVKIINLSLAGPPNELLEIALDRVAQRGVQVVAAAGNEGPLADPVYPAAYPSTLAVAAHDQGLAPYAQGNQGPYIDLSAPGVALQTGIDARDSGTSLAAALVSGSLAASPPQGPHGRRAWLIGHLRDLGPEGRDQVFGWGALAHPIACARRRH